MYADSGKSLTQTNESMERIIERIDLDRKKFVVYLAR